jgi:hypothetical protein
MWWHTCTIMVMTKRSLGIVAWYVPFTETKALCSGIYPRLRKRVTLQMLVSRHVCWLVMSVFAFQYQEWNYMRGGLSTIDRDYGWLNNIHHDIGTHVVHHLFPQIPHYNLIEAVCISYLSVPAVEVFCLYCVSKQQIFKDGASSCSSLIWTIHNHMGYWWC